MISMYSLSLPLLSLHLRYMTDASTLAGEKVLGSFSREITLSRMVLREMSRGVEKKRLKYRKAIQEDRETDERGGGEGKTEIEFYILRYT